MITPYTYADTNPVKDANQTTDVQVSHQHQPKSVMITTQSGQVIYNYHAHKETDPASLTKIMTMYLTLEAMERGDIKGTDKIKITQKYKNMSELPDLSSSLVL